MTAPLPGPRPGFRLAPVPEPTPASEVMDALMASRRHDLKTLAIARHEIKQLRTYTQRLRKKITRLEQQLAERKDQP